MSFITKWEYIFSKKYSWFLEKKVMKCISEIMYFIDVKIYFIDENTSLHHRKEVIVERKEDFLKGKSIIDQ